MGRPMFIFLPGSEIGYLKGGLKIKIIMPK